MAKYNTESIRAVALVGHGGAGKTTLAEALLFKAGAIAAKGAWKRAAPSAISTPRKRPPAIR
jgi:elongation factor G